MARCAGTEAADQTTAQVRIPPNPVATVSPTAQATDMTPQTRMLRSLDAHRAAETNAGRMPPERACWANRTASAINAITRPGSIGHLAEVEMARHCFGEYMRTAPVA